MLTGGFMLTPGDLTAAAAEARAALTGPAAPALSSPEAEAMIRRAVGAAGALLRARMPVQAPGAGFGMIGAPMPMAGRMAPSTMMPGAGMPRPLGGGW